MRKIFIGGTNDAPGFEIYIGADGKLHIRRIPGWNPDSMAELNRAINVIYEATKLRTPGLAEATIRSALEFVLKELDTHAEGSSVLVIK